MASRDEVIKEYREIVKRGRKAIETSAKYALEISKLDNEAFSDQRRHVQGHQSMLVLAFAQSIEDLEVLLDYWERNYD